MNLFFTLQTMDYYNRIQTSKENKRREGRFENISLFVLALSFIFFVILITWVMNAAPYNIF